MTDHELLARVTPGARFLGIVPDGPVTILASQPVGATALKLTYEFGDGQVGQRLLYASVLRCLIVAPGGLVEQWQDELLGKFGLRFDLLTRDLAEANVGGSVFDRYPMLIARMDQLSRSDELLALLRRSEWDLVVGGLLGADFGHFESTGITGDWADNWVRARPPW